jgi:outer membrane lipopolysaccharide assembly protein LptE/RlpB
MGAHDPVVLQAISNVASRYSDEDWWALAPRQRTQAIYDEVRRLDAERMKRRLTLVGKRVEKPIYEVA